MLNDRIKDLEKKLIPFNKYCYFVEHCDDYSVSEKYIYIQIAKRTYGDLLTSYSLLIKLQGYVKNNKNMEKIDVAKAKEYKIENLYNFSKIRRTSKTISCLCPLHDEKTPSFVIYLDKNMFHCFGCAEGGDSIQFVMMLKGINFVQAVKYINDL